MSKVTLEKKTKYPLPVINWNGNTKEKLGGQYESALGKAYALKTALDEIDIHGRDYQTHDDIDGRPAFIHAHEKYMEIIGLYQEIESYILRHCVSIRNQDNR